MPVVLYQQFVMPSYMRPLIVSLVAITEAVLISLAVMVKRHSDHVVIKGSSAFFNLVILFGISPPALPSLASSTKPICFSHRLVQARAWQHRARCCIPSCRSRVPSALRDSG